MFHEVLKRPGRVLFRVGVVFALIGVVVGLFWLSVGVPFLIFGMLSLGIWAGMNYADKAIYRAVTRKLSEKSDEQAKSQGS
jgi:hypothetical protein